MPRKTQRHNPFVQEASHRPAPRPFAPSPSRSTSPSGPRGGGTPATSDPFVLSGADIEQIAPLLAGLRATIKVENATPNVQIDVGFQCTNDGETWETVKHLTTSSITQDGSITTPWYTNTADFLRAIRIVAEIGASSGTAVEMARIAVVVDFELRS